MTEKTYANAAQDKKQNKQHNNPETLTEIGEVGGGCDSLPFEFFVKRLATAGDWAGEHGDLASVLLTELSGWSKSRYITIEQNGYQQSFYPPLVTDRTAPQRPVRLRLLNQHYELISDGKLIPIAPDGDCFYRGGMAIRGLLNKKALALICLTIIRQLRVRKIHEWVVLMLYLAVITAKSA